MEQVLVYCPVYNEEGFIDSTVRSVLGQSYSNLHLLVSENHSNDRSLEILRKFKDSRLEIIQPPHHLSSVEHSEFLNNYIDNNFTELPFSAFIGGHDTWAGNYLEILLRKMHSKPSLALCYADTFEKDYQNTPLRIFPNNLGTEGLKKSLRPLVLLTSITHNIMWGGVWREPARRQMLAKGVPPCAAADHLLLARLSLYGDICHTSETSMGLRRAEGSADYHVYFKKHFGLRHGDTQKGIDNFLTQISVAFEIQDDAVIGDPFFEQETILNGLKSALFMFYLNRYFDLLNFFDGAADQLLDSAELQSVFMAHRISFDNIARLIEKRRFKN